MSPVTLQVDTAKWLHTMTDLVMALQTTALRRRQQKGPGPGNIPGPAEHLHPIDPVSALDLPKPWSLSPLT